MDSNEFNKFVAQCEEQGGKEAAASILFQLAREEMETNSQYAVALGAVKRILVKAGGPVTGKQYERQMNEFFEAVMKDENDHCLKFQWAGSELVDIPVGKPVHVGNPIK